MPRPRPRMIARPGFETLDARVVLSTATPAAFVSAAADTNPNVPSQTGSATTPLPPNRLVPGSHPSADRFRTFTPADLRAYAAAYETFQGEANFTPQFDFNGTGFVGQNDATPILRGLTPITPRIPLRLGLALAPGQQVVGHHPSNNGGVTRLANVTVIGKTTPNSIIFTDTINTNSFGATGNYKFQGQALTSDAQGYFTYDVTLTPLSKNSLTTTNYLIRTPFGQQTIRSFPIFRVG